MYCKSLLFLQLQLSFRPGFSETKDVMVDDIRFEYCDGGDLPVGSDQLSCDFENDTCAWYHDYTASLLWKRDNGRLSGKPSEKG